MQVKCEYCDSFISDTDEICPHCGAVNAHMMRSANGIPKTIAELKAYAEANHLPLEQMRFFIGEDYKEPRAFGIYEENGIFTVYKNKANGERAIRYQGTDEAYAVNELYQKMHSEIIDRKAKQAVAPHMASHPQKTSKRIFMILFIVLLVIVLLMAFVRGSSHKRGYYTYGDDTYYYQGGWYGYGSGGWSPVTPDNSFTDNADNYYDGSGYDSGNGYSDFEDSNYYDSDWGNSDNWDGGSWDSGDTDWNSDW